MQKLSKLTTGLIIMSTLGTTLGVAPTQASAAKWHNGTPTALRKTWKKAKWAGTGKYRFKYYITASANKHSFGSGGLGDPYSISKVKYKKEGKYTYLLSGKEFYSKKTNQVRVIATKHSLKYRIVYSPFYKMKKYSETMYR